MKSCYGKFRTHLLTNFRTKSETWGCDTYDVVLRVITMDKVIFSVEGEDNMAKRRTGIS